MSSGSAGCECTRQHPEIKVRPSWQGQETIALLHYPGRRRRREGWLANVGSQRLASRQMKASLMDSPGFSRTGSGDMAVLPDGPGQH